MLKFAANLTMLFQEVPFLQRFKLAAEQGFSYVEYLFPYAWDKNTLAELLQENQLEQVLFNLPPGNWKGGERGIACLPDRKNEFRDGVEQAIEYAQVLGVPQLNCLSGLTPEATKQTLLWDTLLENVAFATQQLQKHNISLLLEPINSKVDMPGFYLDTLDKALAVKQAINSPKLKIQFDIYHMQIMHGDVSRLLERNLQDIGHIQFADNPGRHEPGTGELNFNYLFRKLDALGYQHWLSAEYIPAHTTITSLDWFHSIN